MDAKNVTIGELTAQIAAEAKRLGYSEASIWRYWMPKMGMIAKYYREQWLCVYDPAITEAFLQGIERQCETGEVSGNYLRQLRQIARRVNEFYLTGTLRIDATLQGTKYVLNSYNERLVEDIFIACTDNLTGFSAAIGAVFPKTEIQNCIIHQLRNSSKYVSYKDIKALMADLRSVYAAVDEPAALDAFSAKWDTKYPKISRSWRENWANFSTYFKYPQEMRRLIYTTNSIEGFNRQLRKVTKTRSVFPTDDSLFKMLYLAMVDITKKWTGRQRDWSVIHAQLSIYFDERMPE